MGLFRESIDFFYGEYKRGFFGKKNPIKIFLYEDSVEGYGFLLDEGEINQVSSPYDIPMSSINKIYVDSIKGENAVCINYKTASVVNNSFGTIVLIGLDDVQKWYHKIEETWQNYTNININKRKLEIEEKEKQYQLDEQREREALEFYEGCILHHIKDSTPVYSLLSEKNKTALVYVNENKSLIFLKIDGYAKEENVGIIEYSNIHYYDKAGNISYISDVKGNYSSYNGGFTGANFSKLAAVGGGFLFGLMGMAIGTALTYKPAETKPSYSNFTIDSDVKKIDDRNVILNFYSEMKKQYVDIEMPHDMYNFLQTYLPEKKYTIVEELEKKTVVHQSANLIETGSLLKVSANPSANIQLESKRTETISLEAFKEKIEKLKMMQDIGLLTDDEFEVEKRKLLSQI